MVFREPLTLPRHIYGVDEWRMVERRFSADHVARNETLFATANGYLGLRATHDEGDPVFHDGTFINGFYESWPIVYGEEAFGFAKTGQTIVNATDCKIIRLYVDDEPFYLPTASLNHYERALDMKNGTLDRELVWEMPSGTRVAIRSRRLTSFLHRHLAVMRYEVTVLNAGAPVVLSSEIENSRGQQDGEGDPRASRAFAHRVLTPQCGHAADRRIILGHRTANSGMSLASGIEHTLETECPYSYESKRSEDSGKLVFSIEARPGVPIRLTKFMAYHSSRRVPAQELCERVERSLDRAVVHGFDSLVADQREYLDDFWHRSDLRIGGDPSAQQVMRFNLFHLLQAVARAEGAGVPAKGLTGQGYEGHYFWDTEIYVLPFLIYTLPRVARNLLKFRHSHLDKARERAREVNQKGALFPWRTINGDEASAYYAAGTAQYHINADIIHALRKYVDVTGDRRILEEFGSELLVETARLWVDLGFYSKRQDGKFCIHGVTGPDEYNTVVNNNAYTNLMARENLRYAAQAVEALRRESPERYEVVVHRTGLDAAEISWWTRAADRMFVPYDEKLGIHPQDDSFLDKECWDFTNTPADRYPLLLHYHPLVIYRHQVIKQADVVLAMFLLGHEFSEEQKKRNFDYYDPLTTGDSSLSGSIQAILAAEVGYEDLAFQYAGYAAMMDLADVGRNVRDGCHIASMGGTWMAAVYGMAGMRDHDGRISFRPHVPKRLKSLRIPLTIRGQLLSVELSREAATYRLEEGDELVFHHAEEEIRLTREDPVCVRPHEGSRTGDP